MSIITRKIHQATGDILSGLLPVIWRFFN